MVKTEAEKNGGGVDGPDVNRQEHDRTTSGSLLPASWRGRYAFAKRVVDAANADRLSLTAAGVAFYVMFALVPSIIALLSVYALFADPDQVRRQLEPLVKALPGEAGDLVVRQLLAVTEIGQGGLTFGLVAGVVAVLWSTSNAVRWLIAGLNIAYGERETRGFLRVRGLALLMTLGALVVVAVSLGLIAAVPVVLDVVGVSGATRVVVNVLRWVGAVLLVGAALAVVYRFGPDREPPRRNWISWGTACALLLWVLGSAGFSLYLSHFSGYHKTYGTVAGVMILLLWLYLSSYAALLGAEVDAEIERAGSADPGTGDGRPRRIRPDA
jgi:membrane protein